MHTSGTPGSEAGADVITLFMFGTGIETSYPAIQGAAAKVGTPAAPRLGLTNDLQAV